MRTANTRALPSPILSCRHAGDALDGTSSTERTPSTRPDRPRLDGAERHPAGRIARARDAFALDMLAGVEGVAGVYLVAFLAPDGTHTPYCGGPSPRGLATHYTGWALDIARRVREHQAGQGAALCRAVVRAGYRVELVRVWVGASRVDERRIKDAHNAARHCPWCLYQLAPISASDPASSTERPRLYQLDAFAPQLAPLDALDVNGQDRNGNGAPTR